MHRNIECRVDGHISRQPILAVELAEGDATHGSMRVTLLVRRVFNQRSDVLFKLCKVRGDITLIELRMLVIAHRSGDFGGKVCTLKI